MVSGRRTLFCGKSRNFGLHRAVLSIRRARWAKWSHTGGGTLAPWRLGAPAEEQGAYMTRHFSVLRGHFVQRSGGLGLGPGQLVVLPSQRVCGIHVAVCRGSPGSAVRGSVRASLSSFIAKRRPDPAWVGWSRVLAHS